MRIRIRIRIRIGDFRDGGTLEFFTQAIQLLPHQLCGRDTRLSVFSGTFLTVDSLEEDLTNFVVIALKEKLGEVLNKGLHHLFFRCKRFRLHLVAIPTLAGIFSADVSGTPAKLGSQRHRIWVARGQLEISPDTVDFGLVPIGCQSPPVQVWRVSGWA